jgi:Mn2+/Fe2+ NRAMP family transporter
MPLSTAYTVCEGLGLESGVDKSFGEAPVFYWLYTLLIIGGAGVVLVPDFPLVKMMLLSQFLNGLLVPVIIIFMLRLINRKDLMGKYKNSLAFNVVAWLTAGIITVLFVVWLLLKPAA